MIDTYIVVRPRRDEDFYLLWDTAKEEPAHGGSREEVERVMLRGSRRRADADFVKRWLSRTDEVGTSVRYPTQTGHVDYDYEDETLIYAHRGFVARGRLRELWERLRGGLDVDDLIVAFTKRSA
jgi:hypothetical protein